MAETQRDIAEYQTDHDIIIEMRADFRGMRSDIQRLTDATTTKTDDHETRLRLVEKAVEAQAASAKTWRYGLSVVLALLTLALTVIAIVVSIHNP